MKKSAFTLVEIVIVLTIVGILTGILLPVLTKNSPKQKVLKFKKANAALMTSIAELTRSDFYLDGNLMIKSDGYYIDGTNEGDTTYFCNTLANYLKTKEVACKEVGSFTSHIGTSRANIGENVADTWCRTTKGVVCPKHLNHHGIKMHGEIHFYEVNPKVPFGWINSYGNRQYEEDGIFKVICVDIDGCDGEDPFGYGINYRGLVQPGARAKEWLDMTVQ